MANLSLLLRRAVTDSRTALACTLVVAFGTGLWVNASAELWAHGPDVFWLTLSMLALQRDRQWLAGAWLCPVIWTRPHLALLAASVGVVLAVARRSVLPLLRVGVPSLLGLSALLLWNNWLFGKPSIGGGYPGRAAAFAATGPSQLSAFGQSAAGSLISPLHGLLVYSPIVLVALPCMLVGLRRCPAWMTACVIGGLAYQVAQWKINGFTGGTGQYSYRLPIELIVLSAPAALVGYQHWRSTSARLASTARLLAGMSIAIHIIGVYWFQAYSDHDQVLDPWRTWGTAMAAGSRGTGGTFVAVAVALSAVTLAFFRFPAAAAPPSGSPRT